jgi:hypothetical protein
LVSPGLQLRLRPMPVPAGVASAMNQREGRHGFKTSQGGARNRARRLGRGFWQSRAARGPGLATTSACRRDPGRRQRPAPALLDRFVSLCREEAIGAVCCGR